MILPVLSSIQPPGWQINNGNTTNTDKDQGKQVSPDPQRPSTALRDRRQEHTQPDHRRYGQRPTARLLYQREIQQLGGNIVEQITEISTNCTFAVVLRYSWVLY